jgi:hypothetical protein
LCRLPGDEKLSNIQYDAEDTEKFVDVFTGEEEGDKKKYRVALPKQVTGINGQQQYVVISKNNISCNAQHAEDCINIVINVPYSKA